MTVPEATSLFFLRDGICTTSKNLIFDCATILFWSLYVMVKIPVWIVYKVIISHWAEGSLMGTTYAQWQWWSNDSGCNHTLLGQLLGHFILISKVEQVVWISSSLNHISSISFSCHSQKKNQILTLAVSSILNYHFLIKQFQGVKEACFTVLHQPLSDWDYPPDEIANYFPAATIGEL